MDTFEQNNGILPSEPVFNETGSSGAATVVPDPVFADGLFDSTDTTANDPFIFEETPNTGIFETAETDVAPTLNETTLALNPVSILDNTPFAADNNENPFLTETTPAPATPQPIPTPTMPSEPANIFADENPFLTEETPAETTIAPAETTIAPAETTIAPAETPAMPEPTPVSETVPPQPQQFIETETPASPLQPENVAPQAMETPRAAPPHNPNQQQMGLETVPEETLSKEYTPAPQPQPVVHTPTLPQVTTQPNESDAFVERAERTNTPQTPKKIDYMAPGFTKELFDNGNVCITAQGGSFPVKDDTRQLLALFSNGRFFVSETYKFDGKVLGFEYLAKKRRLQIGKPEYIPMNALKNIYEYAEQHRVIPEDAGEETVGNDQDQARMQRDFVTIVSRAAMNRVSDIHIVVSDHTTVMFRINGLMQTEMEYNKEWGESFVRAAFASADISDANYAQNEYQAAQKLGRTPLRGSHGKLVLPKNLLGIRLQFNPIAFGTRYVVMRLLYAEENAQSAGDLSALGFTEKEQNLFYKLRAMPTGIVIISGPTGSGKSTTLQRNMISMLQEQNYEINLITVEDPPEYPIPGARQMPVTNASIEEAKDREFTKALSAALRSDPDALMIGEVRSLSAADLAFRGALSGHNVWTTLHANSAPAILMRLKDMGVEDFKLRDPDIVKGLLAQRLFRTLCPHCRIAAKDNLNHPSVKRLRTAFGDRGIEHAYLRGSGCKECDMRGVKGRMAVAELILPDAPFLDLMMKGETQKAMTYWINDLQGMTLRETAQDRMLRGLIDIEEVERWTGLLDQIVHV